MLFVMLGILVALAIGAGGGYFAARRRAAVQVFRWGGNVLQKGRRLDPWTFPLLDRQTVLLEGLSNYSVAIHYVCCWILTTCIISLGHLNFSVLVQEWL